MVNKKYKNIFSKISLPKESEQGGTGLPYKRNKGNPIYYSKTPLLHPDFWQQSEIVLK